MRPGDAAAVARRCAGISVKPQNPLEVFPESRGGPVVLFSEGAELNCGRRYKSQLSSSENRAVSLPGFLLPERWRSCGPVKYNVQVK